MLPVRIFTTSTGNDSDVPTSSTKDRRYNIADETVRMHNLRLKASNHALEPSIGENAGGADERSDNPDWHARFQPPSSASCSRLMRRNSRPSNEPTSGDCSQGRSSGFPFRRSGALPSRKGCGDRPQRSIRHHAATHEVDEAESWTAGANTLRRSQMTRPPRLCVQRRILGSPGAGSVVGPTFFPHGTIGAARPTCAKSKSVDA